MWLARICCSSDSYIRCLDDSYEVVDLDVCKMLSSFDGSYYGLQHASGRIYNLPDIYIRVRTIEELKIKMDMNGDYLDPSLGWRDQDSFSKDFVEWREKKNDKRNTESY